MKSHLTLKQNIDALLRARGQTRRDLAQHVLQTLDKRADSWISHIFGRKGYHARVVPSQYLDRIAAFFGREVHQLFQPGIAGSASERRRDGSERRIAERRIIGTSRALATGPARAMPVSPDDAAVLADLHALPYEQYQRVRGWIAVARYGPRNTPSNTTPLAVPSEGAPPNAAPTPKGRRTRKKPPK